MFPPSPTALVSLNSTFYQAVFQDISTRMKSFVIFCLITALIVIYLGHNTQHLQNNLLLMGSAHQTCLHRHVHASSNKARIDLWQACSDTEQQGQY